MQNPFESEVNPDELLLFQRIHKCVSGMADVKISLQGDDPPPLSALLAEAVSEVFMLRADHGTFHRAHLHSWVNLPSRNIIDVLPIGVIGGPILVSGNPDHLLRHLYSSSPERCRQIRKWISQEAMARRVVDDMKRELVLQIAK